MRDRSYKFRAWIRQGEWDEDGENQAYEMCYDLAFEEYEPINDLLASVEHLMQYTGLKDKNGKEIYEGDIIRDCNGLDATWVVKWCEEEACFLGLDWCGKPNEVVGNIYSNPELLKCERRH